jgi:hypothetical protein
VTAQLIECLSIEANKSQNLDEKNYIASEEKTTSEEVFSLNKDQNQTPIRNTLENELTLILNGIRMLESEMDNESLTDAQMNRNIIKKTVRNRNGRKTNIRVLKKKSPESQSKFNLIYLIASQLNKL